MSGGIQRNGGPRLPQEPPQPAGLESDQRLAERHVEHRARRGQGGGWTVGSLAHESSPGVRWYKPMSIWFEGKNLCTISKKNHLKKKDVKPAQAASSAKGNKRWEGTADTAATALAPWGRRRCTAPSGTPLLRPAAPPPTEDAG